jgi:peptidoglycan-N-acetylglucosamine deacetylase
VIIALGGFRADTLAEDSDMTLSILRSGYQIHHEEYAYAYTEAPDTWGAFAKQRFRWSYGVLQVTWKHRDLLFDPSSPPILRFFIFPNFLIFQIIIPIIAPLVDLALISMIVINITSYMLYGSLFYIEALGHIGASILIFLIIDFLVALIAFSLERGESMRALLLFIPQRFSYRFFMYYINLRALWNALK